jgi:hypothetical protein
MAFSLNGNLIRAAGVALAVTGCSSSPNASNTPDGGAQGAPVFPIAKTVVPLTRCAGGSSSTAFENAAYLARVTVGVQTFELIADTGSSKLVVAGSSCTDCGVMGRYVPGATARDVGKSDFGEYGAGSFDGEYFDDTVRVGDAQAVPVTLVSMTDQDNLIGDHATVCPGSDSFQGILGLAPPSQGERDYFYQLVALGGTPNVLSVGLCNAGGTLWLGGYDPAATTGPVQFTAMNERGYDAVNLTGMAFGETKLDLPSAAFGEAVLDTGTPALWFPSKPRDALMNAIESDPAFRRIFGGIAQFVGGCTTKDIAPSDVDSALPPLTLVFEGNPPAVVVARATSSYLTADTVGGTTSYCLAVSATSTDASGSGSTLLDPSALTILGAAFMRSSVVVYDHRSHRMGFAPHDCK